MSVQARLPGRVKLWAVSKLVPYARNPRTHSQEQVAKIAASIREFGFTNPILIAEDTILAGHGRLRAAQLLGLAQVPVIDLSHLSATQRRAYVIADNRLALDAGWDEALLVEELAALQAEGFDLGVVGMNDAELAKLLGTAVTDPGGEWQDMPEFQQQEVGAFRTIHVHFPTQADVDRFAELIGQAITQKARYIWFPELQRKRLDELRYESES